VVGTSTARNEIPGRRSVVQRAVTEGSNGREPCRRGMQIGNGVVAIISYHEKPGIQPVATTAPDLAREPNVHATFAREHEYRRRGTGDGLFFKPPVLHRIRIPSMEKLKDRLMDAVKYFYAIPVIHTCCLQARQGRMI
jgi:hypothetical protein